MARRFSTKPSTVVKMPINALTTLEPHQVAVAGIDALNYALTLPARNPTEEDFANSIKLYKEFRSWILEKNPHIEGSWCVTNSNPFSLAIFPNELAARMFKQGFGYKAAFYECLGREILEKSEEEEDLFDEENFNEGPDKSYPAMTTSGKPLVWHKALWMPGTWSAGVHSSAPVYMKVDSGAANIGVPSQEVFASGHVVLTKPRLVFGVGGARLARQAMHVSLIVQGKQITFEEVFEHNKFLLGFKWYQHYKTVIDLTSTTPVICTPFNTTAIHG